MASNDVLVFRALPGLGDFLCAVPALRAIRAARPDATVHLVGLESTRPLAERYPRYVDVFHPFPGHAALPEQPPPTASAWRVFIGSMRGIRAGLAFQLHGSGETSNEICSALGAARNAGFVRPGVAVPRNGVALPWDDAEPEPRRWLRLVDAVGIPATDDRLEFVIAPRAAARARRLLRGAGTAVGAAPWAVVHPGAARPHGRWSLDGFRAVARRLAERRLRVVVTGTSDEAPITAAVAAAAPGSVDLAGCTDLDVLGALIADARLLVANDTGAAHLASALGTPSVIVFATGDDAYVKRWAPLDRQRHMALPPVPSLGAVLAAIDRQLTATAAVA